MKVYRYELVTPAGMEELATGQAILFDRRCDLRELHFSAPGVDCKYILADHVYGDCPQTVYGVDWTHFARALRVPEFVACCLYTREEVRSVREIVVSDLRGEIRSLTSTIAALRAEKSERDSTGKVIIEKLSRERREAIRWVIDVSGEITPPSSRNVESAGTKLEHVLVCRPQVVCDHGWDD